jgi:hypothetical protein
VAVGKMAPVLGSIYVSSYSLHTPIWVYWVYICVLDLYVCAYRWRQRLVLPLLKT